MDRRNPGINIEAVTSDLEEVSNAIKLEMVIKLVTRCIADIVHRYLEVFLAFLFSLTTHFQTFHLVHSISFRGMLVTNLLEVRLEYYGTWKMRVLLHEETKN